MEAPAVGPPGVHAQENLSPVLSVGPTGPGLYVADGVTLVVLAAEQRTQLEIVEPTGQRLHRFADLRLEAVLPSLDGHLYEGLGVLDALFQVGMQVQILDHGR